MLNSMRDNNEGIIFTEGGGEGKTAVTTACPKGSLGVNNTSYELTWKVKSDDQNIHLV